MKFDLPFIPTARYVNFLGAHAQQIHSLHFSLYCGGIPDGRQRFEMIAPVILSTELERISGPQKYGLLNSRFHHPALYSDRELTKPLLALLERLLAGSNIDGIIFSDFYFLNFLSATAPELAVSLEAVPSVNFMLDSCDKIEAILAAISRTTFKTPAKIVLDRSLNRKISELTIVSAQMRHKHPAIRLALLANEGCLFHCPFKLTHDAHIGLANTGLCHDSTHRINQDFGCVERLSANPAELFKSPFIRPEDVHRYEELIDVIKICGRTLGDEFLIRVASAYMDGKYSGNLLELMDTMEWLKDKLDVDNSRLPVDFFSRLTSCDHECDACGYCATLYAEKCRPLSLTIKDLRKK